MMLLILPDFLKFHRDKLIFINNANVTVCACVLN